MAASAGYPFVVARPAVLVYAATSSTLQGARVLWVKVAPPTHSLAHASGPAVACMRLLFRLVACRVSRGRRRALCRFRAENPSCEDLSAARAELFCANDDKAAAGLRHRPMTRASTDAAAISLTSFTTRSMVDDFGRDAEPLARNIGTILATVVAAQVAADAPAEQ